MANVGGTNQAIELVRKLMVPATKHQKVGMIISIQRRDVSHKNMSPRLAIAVGVGIMPTKGTCHQNLLLKGAMAGGSTTQQT